ncbi:carotenoid oxygenase [Basidiobolus meristosporus CBS 931.73]|uniref:Carotenoid oxygenase n=1 Tax=Basidiobolus meristosporus CBS 931.73 TaxID=1314790 RepID=A0A1Y1XTY5_9FUNG|nr:carotenoid oxygenase [Basidiobolus meristosporus CBS 931.73]|eukprot:ORX89145.1 carotenoid oxygenase [Basidiobolus meristosporus CBS 931.73]
MGYPEKEDTFTNQEVNRGWQKQAREEVSYWIPEADISGTLPVGLYGTFFRNGPGNDEIGGVKLKHPIDGDGLVCALTFTGAGEVHFKSRFVQTEHRLVEQKLSKLQYRGGMGTNPQGVVQNTWNLTKYMITPSGGKNENLRRLMNYRNPSNTNVFYWEGKLLTSYETGLPHCLDPVTLETLGRDDLRNTLTLRSFGAHFRYDPSQDSLVTLSVKPGLGNEKPRLGINEYGRKWELKYNQVFNIPGLNYAHDFLLSKHFYLVHMSPFVKISRWLFYQFVLGLNSPGESMKYYADLPSRIIAIPRRPEYQKLLGNKPWLELDVDPCHIFHFTNIAEISEGSENGEPTRLTFEAVTLGKNFNMNFDKGVFLSNYSVEPGVLSSFDIDLIDCKCTQRKAHVASVEFPSVHPYRHGIYTRYSYCVASDDKQNPIPFTSILKYDRESQNTELWKSHGVVGEPVFVPRDGYSSSGNEEDDGWVLAQVYLPKQHMTDFVILDAKNLANGPIATIHLKHHVPYGFHGTFTPEVFGHADVRGGMNLRPAKL